LTAPYLIKLKKPHKKTNSKKFFLVILKVYILVFSKKEVFTGLSYLGRRLRLVYYEALALQGELWERENKLLASRRIDQYGAALEKATGDD
jgi:hypothetical protein